MKDIEQAEGAYLGEIITNYRFGPLGKLHNLVVTYARNPDELQRFEVISNGVTLPRDNSDESEGSY